MNDSFRRVPEFSRITAAAVLVAAGWATALAQQPAQPVRGSGPRACRPDPGGQVGAFDDGLPEGGPGP